MHGTSCRTFPLPLPAVMMDFAPYCSSMSQLFSCDSLRQWAGRVSAIKFRRELLIWLSRDHGYNSARLLCLIYVPAISGGLFSKLTDKYSFFAIGLFRYPGREKLTASVAWTPLLTVNGYRQFHRLKSRESRMMSICLGKILRKSKRNASDLSHSL